MHIFLQKFAEAVHHIPFMFKHGVSVTVECDRCVFVSENFGKRFYIHAAFKRAGGKGMSKRVKAFMQNIEFFQQEFKCPLI